MRVIKDKSEKEHKLKCARCRSIIKYTAKDIECEYYTYVIKCPLCEHRNYITIKK